MFARKDISSVVMKVSHQMDASGTRGGSASPPPRVDETKRAGGMPKGRSRMVQPATIKTLGYVISTLSVALLGIVSWKSASADILLMLCLLGGMATSITGMALRWLSYRMEQ